eukprot:COSAG02_NODE_8147_length_2690_cov_1.538016_2_plen_59_part_00
MGSLLIIIHSLHAWAGPRSDATVRNPDRRAYYGSSVRTRDNVVSFGLGPTYPCSWSLL